LFWLVGRLTGKQAGYQRKSIDRGNVAVDVIVAQKGSAGKDSFISLAEKTTILTSRELKSTIYGVVSVEGKW